MRGGGKGWKGSVGGSVWGTKVWWRVRWLDSCDGLHFNSETTKKKLVHPPVPLQTKSTPPPRSQLANTSTSHQLRGQCDRRVEFVVC